VRRRRKPVDAALERLRDPAPPLAALVSIERQAHRARAPGGWPRAQVDRVFEALAKVATSPHAADDARIAALYALRGLFEGRAARVLLAVLADTSAPSTVRADAGDGLGYLGADVVARSAAGMGEAATVLAAAARDPSPDVRFGAIYAIGALALGPLRDAVAARVDDGGVTREGWTVGEEARAVLGALEGGCGPGT